MGLVGGLEMGGTKMVCGVSLDGTTIARETSYPTGADAAAALASAAQFFSDVQREYGPLTGLGVAAFGPCNPDPHSPGYGRITTTPKPGWRDVDVLGTLRDRLGDVPMAFDTDVNAAALGEFRHGAGRGLDCLVYLTVGTGIGGGAVLGGRLVHGLTHPEIGHMPIRRPPTEDFPGVCPYHGDCLEGVASGPALTARWGRPGRDLPADHPAWDLQAQYLGLALATLVLVVSPQRIILGGGVGLVPHLLPRVRRRLLGALAGYIQHPLLSDGAEQFVVHPLLGHRAGLIGAFSLSNLEVTL